MGTMLSVAKIKTDKHTTNTGEILKHWNLT